jgi:hypothetical protein
MHALTCLIDWVNRGIAEDRSFEIRYLGGIKHPWNVRVEDEPRGWSCHEDTCSTLGLAVRLVLGVAHREGFL